VRNIRRQKPLGLIKTDTLTRMTAKMIKTLTYNLSLAQNKRSIRKKKKIISEEYNRRKVPARFDRRPVFTPNLMIN